MLGSTVHSHQIPVREFRQAVGNVPVDLDRQVY